MCNTIRKIIDPILHISNTSSAFSLPDSNSFEDIETCHGTDLKNRNVNFGVAKSVKTGTVSASCVSAGNTHACNSQLLKQSKRSSHSIVDCSSHDYHSEEVAICDSLSQKHQDVYSGGTESAKTATVSVADPFPGNTHACNSEVSTFEEDVRAGNRGFSCVQEVVLKGNTSRPPYLRKESSVFNDTGTSHVIADVFMSVNMTIALYTHASMFQ